jgi:hypothetical protein
MPGGITIRPDGIHPVDPCRYRLVESHKNVTVSVHQCDVCGDIDISWFRQDDTESETFGEFKYTD